MYCLKNTTWVSFFCKKNTNIKRRYVLCVIFMHVNIQNDQYFASFLALIAKYIAKKVEDTYAYIMY